MRAVFAGCGTNPLGSAALEIEAGENRANIREIESVGLRNRFLTSS
jgi:hypothetical protein